MNPVSTIFAKTYPFGLKNVDTDVIILAASLILEKVLGMPRRKGLADGGCSGQLTIDPLG